MIPRALVGNLINDVFHQAREELKDEDSYTDSGYDAEVSPYRTRHSSHVTHTERPHNPKTRSSNNGVSFMPKPKCYSPPESIYDSHSDLDCTFEDRGLKATSDREVCPRILDLDPIEDVQDGAEAGDRESDASGKARTSDDAKNILSDSDSTLNARSSDDGRSIQNVLNSSPNAKASDNSKNIQRKLNSSSPKSRSADDTVRIEKDQRTSSSVLTLNDETCTKRDSDSNSRARSLDDAKRIEKCPESSRKSKTSKNEKYTQRDTCLSPTATNSDDARICQGNSSTSPEARLLDNEKHVQRSSDSSSTARDSNDARIGQKGSSTSPKARLLGNGKCIQRDSDSSPTAGSSDGGRIAQRASSPIIKSKPSNDATKLSRNSPNLSLDERNQKSEDTLRASSSSKPTTPEPFDGKTKSSYYIPLAKPPESRIVRRKIIKQVPLERTKRNLSVSIRGNRERRDVTSPVFQNQPTMACKSVGTTYESPSHSSVSNEDVKSGLEEISTKTNTEDKENEITTSNKSTKTSGAASCHDDTTTATTTTTSEGDKMVNTLRTIDDSSITTIDCTTTATSTTTGTAAAAATVNTVRYDETTLFWIEAMTTDIETLWGEIRGLRDAAETHHKEYRLVEDTLMRKVHNELATQRQEFEQSLEKMKKKENCTICVKTVKSLRTVRRDMATQKEELMTSILKVKDTCASSSQCTMCLSLINDLQTLKEEMLSQKREFVNSMKQVGEMYGGSCTMCMTTTGEMSKLKQEMMIQKDEILQTLNKMKKMRCEKCTRCTPFVDYTSTTLPSSPSPQHSPLRIQSSPKTGKRKVADKPPHSAPKRLSKSSKTDLSDDLSKLSKTKSSNTFKSSSISRSNAFRSNGIEFNGLRSKLGASCLTIGSRSSESSPKWSFELAKELRPKQKDKGCTKSRQNEISSSTGTTYSATTKRTQSLNRYPTSNYQRIVDSFKDKNRQPSTVNRQPEDITGESHKSITDVSSLVEGANVEIEHPAVSRDLNTLKVCAVNELKLDQRKLDEKLRTLKNEINDLARYADDINPKVLAASNIRRTQSAVVHPVHSVDLEKGYSKKTDEKGQKTKKRSKKSSHKKK